MLTNIHIDILLPIGGQGGVENVVNKIAPYLQKQGACVRVVQFVWSGIHWVHESLAFYPLVNDGGEYSSEQLIGHYTGFMTHQGKPDIILATAWPLMTLVAQESLKRLNKGTCKIISWPHQSIDVYASTGCGGMEYLALSDAIFALNQKTYNMIKAHNKDCKVFIVKNPVNFTQCPIQPAWITKDRTLLFVGRLAAQKRVDIILEAVSLAKDTWKLILIGEGEEEGTLQELVRFLHIERQVYFMGWIDNPWETISGISAFVMASDYECLPLSAIESLASGIPVISTPVDGIIEIIKPGINGFLYPLKDSRRLADILDAMADGILPVPAPEACRESVMDFEETEVLCVFAKNLVEVLNK